MTTTTSKQELKIRLRALLWQHTPIGAASVDDAMEAILDGLFADDMWEHLQNYINERVSESLPERSRS